MQTDFSRFILFLYFNNGTPNKGSFVAADHSPLYKLEIVFTRAAPAFDNLFMGCVFNINTVHKTVEKLTFQAFY